MGLTEPTQVFFSPADFGEVALYNGATIVDGLFDVDGMQVLGDLVETVRPVFTCAASALLAVAHGDTLVIRGVTYKVCGLHPSWPIMQLELERQ